MRLYRRHSVSRWVLTCPIAGSWSGPTCALPSKHTADARARSKLERLLKCTTVPELRALYQELGHACSAMLAYDRAALREAVVEQLCRDRNRQ